MELRFPKDKDVFFKSHVWRQLNYPASGRLVDIYPTLNLLIKRIGRGAVWSIVGYLDEARHANGDVYFTRTLVLINQGSRQYCECGNYMSDHDLFLAASNLYAVVKEF